MHLHVSPFPFLFLLAWLQNIQMFLGDAASFFERIKKYACLNSWALADWLFCGSVVLMVLYYSYQLSASSYHSCDLFRVCQSFPPMLTWTEFTLESIEFFIRSLTTWAVPLITMLVCAALAVATVILAIIPLRYLLLLWGKYIEGGVQLGVVSD